MLNSAPLLEAICDPVGIRVIELRPTDVLAYYASLVVDSSVVSAPLVHADSDCNSLARPAILLAFAVPAFELAHNVGITAFDIRACVVRFEESECQAVVCEQLGHLLVQFWI